jgi:hypothetical protein
MQSFALPVWTTDGMYLVNGCSGALFLTPSPLDLNHYRGVVLKEIQISTKRRSRDLKPSEEERLKGYFTRRLEYVFERNGWPIVETPAEDVLRVWLAVKDLELGGPRRSHSGNIVSGVTLRGEALGPLEQSGEEMNLAGPALAFVGDRAATIATKRPSHAL